MSGSAIFFTIIKSHTDKCKENQSFCTIFCNVCCFGGGSVVVSQRGAVHSSLYLQRMNVIKMGECDMWSESIRIGQKAGESAL